MAGMFKNKNPPRITEMLFGDGHQSLVTAINIHNIYNQLNING